MDLNDPNRQPDRELEKEARPTEPGSLSADPQASPGSADQRPAEDGSSESNLELGTAPEAEPDREAGLVETPERITSPLADGSRRALPERAVSVERQAGWIMAAFILVPLLVGLVLGWLLGGFPLWVDLLLTSVWIALVILFTWLNVRFVALEHEYKSWRLSPDSIDLWQGVLWRRMTSIPRSRVQHTDVSQGPLQRSFELATLSIHTAGTEYAKVDFTGLDHETALAVRDFLLDRDGPDGV